METLNTSLTRATVQDTANAAAQDIATNNPVPNLNASQPIRPVDDQTLWEAKKKREASTTTLDYVTAAMHQDGFLNGFIANHVGNDMAVDPNFNILDPKTFEEHTKGLPDSLKPVMMDAHSAAHAMYLRSLLDDKMTEQTRLGDLGWKGQTVRLVGGLVSPENLAMMASTMGIGGIVGGGSNLARATRALQLTTEMAEGPARVAAVAEATAALQKAAAEASTLRAGAAQIAGAAGINAGLEKLRQTYNFEDDTSGVLHAGLVGATLGAPFAFLHGREMARLRETAGNELALLNHIKAGAGDVAPEVLAQDTAMRRYMADALVGEHIPAGAAAEGQRALPRGALEGEGVRVSDPAAIAQQRLLEGPKDIVDLKEPGTRTEREHPATPDDHYGPDDLLPEGMEGGSVGAAQAVPQAGGIAPTYLRNGRLDFYATLNRNPNTVVQELAHILIKDPIGNSKTEAQGWSASELKRNIQRTVGGEFHREALTAMKDAMLKMAVPVGDRGRFADDFYRAVSKVTRGDPDVATTHAAILPELQRAAAQQQKVYEKILERAKAAGVKGAQGVDVNAAYVNRVFNFQQISDLIRKHGEDPDPHHARERDAVAGGEESRGPDARREDVPELDPQAGVLAHGDGRAATRARHGRTALGASTGGPLAVRGELHRGLDVRPHGFA
jgi:hypothetical protein